MLNITKEMIYLTILTLEDIFVNYDNVTKIVTYSDVVEDSESGEIDVAVIKAHLVGGKKIILGVYSEPDQLAEVINDLANWFENSNGKALFRMPVPKMYAVPPTAGEDMYE